MMQNVHVTLNPGCPGKSSIQQEEDSYFHQQTGLAFKKETSEMLKSYTESRTTGIAYIQ